METRLNLLHLSVIDHAATMSSSIKRRQHELEDDLNANVLLENRIISERLSSIQGLKKHLSQSKLTKSVVYEKQEVMDVHGHGSIVRADLHKKYNTKI